MQHDENDYLNSLVLFSAVEKIQSHTSTATDFETFTKLDWKFIICSTFRH
jgi:hypothetical protein